MRIRLILCLVTAMLLIATVQATRYQENAGPWTIEFNSSQSLTFQKQQMDDPMGTSGWAISLIDNENHEIGGFGLYDSKTAIPIDNTVLDGALDGALQGGYKVSSSMKSPVKVDGTEGRQAEGYAPTFKRTVRAVIYPYKSHYDSFYSQNVATNIILYSSMLDIGGYNEITNSLHVTRYG